MLAESVKSGEVEGRAEACADDGGKSPPPELVERIRYAGDFTEGLDEGGGPGLLDPGLEKVGGLQYGGRKDTSTKASNEVKR